MAMRLVSGALIYFLATVVVGFSVIFMMFGGGLADVWGQHIGIVLSQIAIPRRTPFAVAIVSFVASVPLMLGLWHAARITSQRLPNAGAVASFAALATLSAYGVLLLAVFALAQAAPMFSVMEGVNLKFALIALGVWSIIAIALAILAGAVVNHLFRRAPQVGN
jgi:hypothetical protein